MYVLKTLSLYRKLTKFEVNYRPMRSGVLIMYIYSYFVLRCYTSHYNKRFLTYSLSYLLTGRVLDSRPKDRGFEPHRRHCVVSLSKNINPSLVLVQPRTTRPFITERLLMGRKESNQKMVAAPWTTLEIRDEPC